MSFALDLTVLEVLAESGQVTLLGSAFGIQISIETSDCSDHIIGRQHPTGKAWQGDSLRKPSTTLREVLEPYIDPLVLDCAYAVAIAEVERFGGLQ
jgi:hypothetical protein